MAAAVPPYLYTSDDNPDGGLDDATITQFETGVRTDRPAFLDGFTGAFFNAGGKGLLHQVRRGERADAVVPFEVSGRRSHEATVGGQFVVIEGGPHGINASHPEQFNAALLEFLSR
jgi:non-heme chloroperoxidase